ncbi:hypothetical protein [Atopomonas sediminilitoris]|uniref:hypothetical protein n=1 Tax=Atopomonas sediminilitoris TaxID=2919919 RepID=UPI001F4E4E9C|nr:hypothetical protein [Atopomonas sediminilitoris]MCJ8170560.1 hypothetical protein [Atopomonas sediminilitoris]
MIDQPIRHLYLYFNDGQRLALSYPQQDGDTSELSRRMQAALSAPFLSLEVDGDLLLIPRESIKYIQVCPLPHADLPAGTLLGAQMLD